jgi:hypothetical protein
MRARALAVAVLVAGGIGCSDSGKSTSVTTTGTHGDGDGGDGGAIADGGGDPDLGGVVDMGGGGGGMTDMADPAGPWPLADVTIYGAAHGLDEPLLDANPDDGQEIWAAGRDALYVLHPGETTFHKFTAADGLHIGPFTDYYGNANQTSITAIAGGAPGQVYVGYYGFESDGDPYKDTEAQKALGNGDDVRVNPDGTLAITRLLFRCDAERFNGCWENRSPRRILYAHDGVAAGHSFWGFNHGVSHVLGDDFGDHVHPEAWYQPGNMEKLGEFYALALDGAGNLWMGGRYAVGLQPWNPKPHGADPAHDEWVSGRFIYAFTTDTDDHALDVASGYHEDNRGAAVTPDGRLWLARLNGGLVSWDPKSQNFGKIQRWGQVPSNLLDVQADPDGTLWLVTTGGELLRFDPGSGALQSFDAVRGVRRMYVESTVVPRAVDASTSGGLAVIRAK